MPAAPSPGFEIIGRLRDGTGRIVWDSPAGCRVWKGGRWVPIAPSDGITCGAIMDSQPLDEFEIAEMRSAGIFDLQASST